MRFIFQHKYINPKEYGKGVSPLCYDTLALILCRSIFSVYGKQSEKYVGLLLRDTFWSTHFLGYYLRIAYNIDRFSEDLAFDCKGFSKDEFIVLTDDVVRYLTSIGYDVTTNDRLNPRLKAFRRNIHFPKLLYDEGLSPHLEERFLLKIEAEDQGVVYPTEKRIVSRAGFYFPICLPTVDVLCAMKVSAFLNRAKGRDIYDLMFLLG